MIKVLISSPLSELWAEAEYPDWACFIVDGEIHYGFTRYEGEIYGVNRLGSIDRIFWHEGPFGFDGHYLGHLDPVDWDRLQTDFPSILMEQLL